MVTQDAARPEHDFYRTPDWAIEAILRRLAQELTPRTILEPAAGDGALLGPLRRAWPEATIDAYDIAPQHDAVIKRPFWFDDTPQRYELVITNPPYSAAGDFVAYGLTRLARRGWLVLGPLRLAFLASQERRAMFRRDEPDVFVLPQRPSFRNGRSDFSDYAWFVWHEGRRRRWGRIEHL
jgi:hypothetical protein